jgi:hypothetical protein
MFCLFHKMFCNAQQIITFTYSFDHHIQHIKLNYQNILELLNKLAY